MDTYSFAPIENTTIHYHTQGTGPALVLIHAGIADLRMWDDQMADFSRKFTVIRYDVRGWGQTPCPPGEYRDHEDLQRLLAHLGHNRAHLLGCSNGGRIVLDFALAFPELAERLVLVGAAVGGYEWTDPETAVIDQAMEAAYASGDISRAVELDAQLWVDGLYRQPGDVDPAVRRRAVKMLQALYALPDEAGTRLPLDPPAASRLGEIQSPTLALVGDLDTPDILRIADLLNAEISSAQQFVFQGAAHLPNMEQPEVFNRVVLDFLSGPLPGFRPPPNAASGPGSDR